VFIAPTTEGLHCVGVIGYLTVHGVGVGGRFVLWLVFQKDVKYPIREDGLVVIDMVVGEVFCMYMKSFECVKVWCFSVVS
jgi:hypothetical protein